jgi:hypothetical protein
LIKKDLPLMMRPMLMAIAAILATASASVPAVSYGADGQADGVQVTVTRDGEQWTADYVLDHDAPVWAFSRSALEQGSRRAWRLRQWRVDTPGVVLERRGDYDVLRSLHDRPVPRRVRLIMTPASADLEADYDPALMFTDGAVALYTDHFNVIPLGSIQAALDLPRDLNGVDVPGEGPARIRFQDRAGPVLFRGERYDAVNAQSANTYVLFGAASLVDDDAIATIIDPGLPTWIGEELRAFSPRVFDMFAQRLGPKPGDRPVVMVSWNGPSSGVSSMGGSVMPDLISMSFEGDRVLARSPEVLGRARWFIGHEAAHFWLGQAVRYEFARDAWITEGGADLMAVRALQSLNPSYNAESELQSEVDDCIGLTTGGRSVSTAAGRGEHRAYYACGAVFWMVAEASLHHARLTDVFDYMRPLLDQNREDGVLTAQEWFDHLTYKSDDPTLARDIQRMTDEGVSDPAAMIASLFERVGIPHDHAPGMGVRLR